jgi:hypothetical protein
MSFFYFYHISGATLQPLQIKNKGKQFLAPMGASLAVLDLNFSSSPHNCLTSLGSSHNLDYCL